MPLALSRERARPQTAVAQALRRGRELRFGLSGLAKSLRGKTRVSQGDRELVLGDLVDDLSRAQGAKPGVGRFSAVLAADRLESVSLYDTEQGISWIGLPAADGSGDLVLEKFDMSSFPSCGLRPDLLTGGGGALVTPPAPISSSQFTVEPTAAEVTVMVLWTTTARQAAGSVSAMQALATQSVAVTNQVFSNSLLPITVRLVHSGEVNYAENLSAPFENALVALRGTTDGAMDEIHALRDSVGADLVSLIVEHGEACGVGYQLTSGAPSSAFASYGFNLVSRECAVGNLSFPHELGHNLGASHERAQGERGAFDFSFGWGDRGASGSYFRSVMAYDAVPGVRGTRIPVYSNPDVTYDGRPTGVAISAGNAAHNAETIGRTAIYVANYKYAPGEGDTLAPTVSLTAPAGGATVSGGVALQASASDNVGVSRVDFTVDGNIVATDLNNPYSVNWNSAQVANGTHRIAAVAYDAAGNFRSSSEVTVNVSNAGGATTTTTTTTPTTTQPAPATTTTSTTLPPTASAQGQGSPAPSEDAGGGCAPRSRAGRSRR